MWAAVISALLPVATWIFSEFIKGKKGNTELKAAYRLFVEKMAEDGTNSAKLRKSYKAQLERLKKG